MYTDVFGINLGQYRVILSNTSEDGPTMLIYKHNNLANQITLFGPEMELLMEAMKKVL